MPSVADLLAQSRAAHQKSKTLRGRIDARGTVSQRAQLPEAGQAIQQALSARLEAHALDPQQTDAAWQADQRLNQGVTSDALVQFLGRYLTPAEARVG
jgi:hypothetical protein